MHYRKMLESHAAPPGGCCLPLDCLDMGVLNLPKIVHMFLDNISLLACSRVWSHVFCSIGRTVFVAHRRTNFWYHRPMHSISKSEVSSRAAGQCPNDA